MSKRRKLRKGAESILSENQPGAMPFSAADNHPGPVVGNGPPATPIVAPEHLQPKVLGLVLGEHRYALCRLVTTDGNIQVWTGDRLAADVEGIEILPTTGPTYERLSSEATNYHRDQVAACYLLKLAVPETESDLALETEQLKGIVSPTAYITYPAGGGAWPAEFSCLVVECKGAEMLKDWHHTWSETQGLSVILHLVELLAGLAERRLTLSESLNEDNLIVGSQADQSQLFLVRWRTEELTDTAIRDAILPRLAEILVRLLAPAISLSTSLEQNPLLLRQTGHGAITAGVTEWDALTFGTHSLVYRLLTRSQNGSAIETFQILQAQIQTQLDCWNDPSPLERYRRESGAARLNWLDVAAARGLQLSPDEESERVRILRELIDDAGRDREHWRGLFDLSSALRRYPAESYFRWATMAHLVSAQSSERAYQRMRFAEVLGCLRDEKKYGKAAALMAEVRVRADEDQSVVPSLRPILQALCERARLLARSIEGLGWTESWETDLVEEVLVEVQALDNRCQTVESALFGDRPDQVCESKIEALRNHLEALHEEQGHYEALIGKYREEIARQVRELNFSRQINQAQCLAELGSNVEPELWLRAIQLYERAAAEYPSVFNAEHIMALEAVKNRVVSAWAEQAKTAIEHEQIGTAAGLLQSARGIALRAVPITEVQAFILSWEQGCAELDREKYDSALANLQQANLLAWPAIKPAVESRWQLAQVGLLLNEARQMRDFWPASAPHAADCIDRSVQAYCLCAGWDGPEVLSSRQTAFCQDSVTLLNDAFTVLKTATNEALARPEGHVVLYRHTSYETLMAAVKKARRAADRMRKVSGRLNLQWGGVMAEEGTPLVTPADDLYERLDTLWRRATALYEFERSRVFLDDGDYGPALATALLAESVKCDDVEAAAARQALRPLIRAHLKTYWQAIYDRAFDPQPNVVMALTWGHKQFMGGRQLWPRASRAYNVEDRSSGSRTTRLRSLQARLRVAEGAPHSWTSLGELGNLYLDKCTQATACTVFECLLDGARSDKRRALFLEKAADVQPAALYHRLFHYDNVIELLARKRDGEARELARRADQAQRMSADVADQRTATAQMIKKQIEVYWGEAYEEIMRRRLAAEPIQKRLRKENLSGPLAAMADERWSESPNLEHTAQKLAALIENDDSRIEFLQLISVVRPSDYADLLPLLNACLAQATRRVLDEARVKIYRRREGSGTRFSLKRTLSYCGDRERQRTAGKRLILARRLAPNTVIRRDVALQRLNSWLLSYGIYLGGVVVVLSLIWVWIQP